jgi:hypothetical protein
MFVSFFSRRVCIDRTCTSTLISHLVQWPLPTVITLPINLSDTERTRNQLNELNKKMLPIQQMILSLQPKKKYALIEYIPDFESYDNDVHVHAENLDDDVRSSLQFDVDDSDSQESLSERLYKEMDEQTTRTH